MKKYLFIVLLVGVCFGQDVYPYFSDMGKQLEFEQKKILVTLVKEKQQVISGGGSEFNWLSLMSNYEPTYKIAPIKLISNTSQYLILNEMVKIYLK